MNYDSVPYCRVHPIDQSAFSTVNGLKHSYLCAQEVERSGISGCFVECGTASGVQVAMMDRALQDMGRTRQFHVFDSFQGIPMSGPMDDEQPGYPEGPTHDINAPISERLVSSGIASVSRDQVEANLKAWVVKSKVFLHEGWFQDVLPQWITSHSMFVPGIALLRLDGDLYESTKVCLEYLYPHVVPGGLVIIDDYGYAGCKAAVHEYLDEHRLTPDIHLDDVGYTIARWNK